MRIHEWARHRSKRSTPQPVENRYLYSKNYSCTANVVPNPSGAVTVILMTSPVTQLLRNIFAKVAKSSEGLLLLGETFTMGVPDTDPTAHEDVPALDAVTVVPAGIGNKG